MGRFPLLVPILAAAGLIACGDPPPSILVVVMDTTRGDRVSFAGYDRPTTPNLKALAAESTVWTDAWSPACWTGPAHASLFTGKRPENHGYLEGIRLFLEPSEETLAERFAKAGWRTHLVTNNLLVSSMTGLVQGFQTVETCAGPGGPGEEDSAWAHARAREHLAAAKAAGKPAFVVVNDLDPHLPYRPPPAIEKQFVDAAAPAAEVIEARKFDGPQALAFCIGRFSVGPDRWRILSDLYDAEIRSLDREIGSFVGALRQDGLLDDLVLVVTSDHGENLGDHGLADHQFSLNRSLLHVPLLIRHPPTFAAGRTVSDSVRLEDVPPTLLEIAGLSIPADLDGLSLTKDVGPRICRGALGPPVATRLERDFPGFTQSPFSRGIRSVYDGRHHLLRYSDGEERLYDVQADPGEKRNLAGELPDVRAALREHLSK